MKNKKNRIIYYLYMSMLIFFIYLILEINQKNINFLRIGIFSLIFIGILFFLKRQTDVNYNKIIRDNIKKEEEIDLIDKKNKNIIDEIQTYKEMNNQVTHEIEYYEKILDHLSDNIFIVDEKNTMIYSNKKFKKMMNNSTNKLENSNFKLDYSKHINAHRTLFESEIKEVELFENGIMYKKNVIFIDSKPYVLSIGFDRSKLTETNEQLAEKIKKMKLMEKDINKNHLKLNSILDFMNSFESIEDLDIIKFLKRVFKYTYDLVEIADCGSAFIFKDGLVKYIDARGHKLDLLKQITIYQDNFFNNRTNEPVIIKDILKKTKGYYHDQLVQASVPIAETLSFSMIIEKTPIAIISLDISREKNKSFSEEEIELVSNISKLVNIIISLFENKQKSVRYTNDILSAFLTLMEIHKEALSKHSKRVAEMSKSFAKYLNLSDDEIIEIYWSALMHDIGFLLESPDLFYGELGFEDDLNDHVINAYNVMKNIEGLENVAKNIYYHHEKFDGSGYPNKVSGNNIPKASQIISIVNYFDTVVLVSNVSLDEFIIKVSERKNIDFRESLVDEFISFIESQEKDWREDF